MATITSPLDELEPPEGELVQDRDTYEVELSDGSTVRYKLTLEGEGIAPMDIEDPEVFGRYEFVQRSNYTGRSARPDGFDGAARKLHLGNNHPMYEDLWFQPPKDVQSDPELLRAHVDYVREILTWGYTLVMVEVTHVLPNGYSNSWTSCIGAVEPFPDRETIQDFADDLVAGLTNQLKEAS